MSHTGATVGHKRKSCGIGTRKSIAQEQEDWIIVDGMHEAIVSKEEFELAQSVIRGGEKKPVRKHQKYPLKGSGVLRELQAGYDTEKAQKWQRHLSVLPFHP